MDPRTPPAGKLSVDRSGFRPPPKGIGQQAQKKMRHDCSETSSRNHSNSPCHSDPTFPYHSVHSSAALSSALGFYDFVVGAGYATLSLWAKPKTPEEHPLLLHLFITITPKRVKNTSRNKRPAFNRALTAAAVPHPALSFDRQADRHSLYKHIENCYMDTENGRYCVL